MPGDSCGAARSPRTSKLRTKTRSPARNWPQEGGSLPLAELLQNRVEGLFCPAVEGCAGCTADWVRDDNSTRIGEEQLFGHLVGQVAEGFTRHDDCGYAACFKGFRVVETPRRAAPSIRCAREDHLNFLSETVE